LANCWLTNVTTPQLLENRPVILAAPNEQLMARVSSGILIR
jgi:hypothetical protein